MDLSPSEYLSLKEPVPSLSWRATGGCLQTLSVDWSTFAENRRKVVTKRPHRMVGLIPAPWKAKEALEHESQLEADFIKQILLVPGVEMVSSQPQTFVFSHSVAEVLKRKSYTPDFLVQFDDGAQLLVEVRHSARVQKDLDFFTQFGYLLQSAGISYAVVTDQCIQRKRSRVTNAGLLYRYARSERLVPDLNLECGQSFTFGDLIDHCDGDQQMVYKTIARKKFDWNLNADIHRKTVLTQIKRRVGDECYHASHWFGI